MGVCRGAFLVEGRVGGIYGGAMLLLGQVRVVVVCSAAGDAVRMLYGWAVGGVETTVVVFEVAFLVEGRKGRA